MASEGRSVNPTSLVYWWPVVSALGLLVPRTEVVALPEPDDAEVVTATCLVHEGHHDADSPECETALDRLMPALREAAARIGYPLFLRTDMVSGKHSFEDTCYVPDAASLREHAFAVAEEHGMAMFMERDAPLRAFAVREFLALNAPFKAFGGMPVAAERRYFVNDGEVICHHAYWSDIANIERGLMTREDYPHDWMVRLHEVNHEWPEEVAALTKRATIVAEALPGAWSVDFAQGEHGSWYLIDMAIASRSWHEDGCPSALAPRLIADEADGMETGLADGRSTAPDGGDARAEVEEGIQG